MKKFTSGLKKYHKRQCDHEPQISTYGPKNSLKKIFLVKNFITLAHSEECDWCKFVFELSLVTLRPKYVNNLDKKLRVCNEYFIKISLWANFSKNIPLIFFLIPIDIT